jgi:hypothetical protein
MNNIGNNSITMDLNYFDAILKSNYWIHNTFWQKHEEMIRKTTISTHPNYPLRIIHDQDFALDNLDDLGESIMVSGMILADDDDQEGRMLNGDEDELLDYLPDSFFQGEPINQM